jgi:hypothetical protein
VKKVTCLIALVAGFVLTTDQDASAADFLFFHFEDDYSYSSPAPYTPPQQQQQPVRHEQPAKRTVGFFQPVRDTAGNVVELYMDLSPGAQVAESMGLLDRGFVLGLFR